MTIPDILILFAVGLVAGVVNILAGGGSLLTLPVLLFLGLPAAMANGTNRVAILVQNIVASGSFRRSGYLPLKTALTCAPTALIGSILGARMAIHIGEDQFRAILAGVIMMVCAVMIFDPVSKLRADGRAPLRGRTALLAGTFLLIGFYGGFIQAGVGFLIIAALMVHGLDLVRVNAVKVFVVGLFTAAALAVFVVHGQVDWPRGLALASGNALGGWMGTRLAIKRGHAWIRRLVLTVALLFALNLLRQALLGG
ncbi:integrase [bacterium CG_4_9_14_3_um_filter_65_15]|nr:MAG: integrase [bacterium CG_4_9_14_3_um_filter_65_15]